MVCAVEHLVGYFTHHRRSLTLELDGFERIEVGGGGKPIAGDPLDFVLVATGRKKPVPMGLEPWIDVYGT